MLGKKCFFGKATIESFTIIYNNEPYFKYFFNHKTIKSVNVKIKGSK